MLCNFIEYCTVKICLFVLIKFSQIPYYCWFQFSIFINDRCLDWHAGVILSRFCRNLIFNNNNNNNNNNNKKTLLKSKI